MQAMTVDEENELPLSEALMRAAADTDDEALARLYEWIARTYSSQEYAKIRVDHEGKVSPKFLAICERMRRLMPIAKWLSWDTKSNLKTLDLGSGAGHMGMLANFFGHSALGIDDSSRFDRLREFWAQTVLHHSIEAGRPLPPIGRFHSITAILTNFGRNWTVSQWGDFLDRIIADHLEPDGEFILHFPGNQILDYRTYLRQRASRTEGEGRFMIYARS